MNPINVTGYDRAERAAWAAEKMDRKQLLDAITMIAQMIHEGRNADALSFAQHIISTNAQEGVAK